MRRLVSSFQPTAAKDCVLEGSAKHSIDPEHNLACKTPIGVTRVLQKASYAKGI
jgi:hypothetical protein